MKENENSSEKWSVQAGGQGSYSRNAELYTKGILKGKTMRAGVENLLPVDEALNYIISPAHIHIETLESTSGVPADQSTSEWVATVHCVLMKHYAGIFL